MVAIEPSKMSLQWLTIGLILSSEIIFIILLMLPWVSPVIWLKFFRSKFMRLLERYAYIFQYTFGGILTLLFLDSIRETYKYKVIDVSMDIKSEATAPQASQLNHMRLFRAECSLYTTGSIIFLALVCYRMVQMVMKEAKLMAAADVSLKQAQLDSATAQMLTEKDPKKRAKLEAEDEEKKKELIAALRKQLQEAEEDRDEMRSEVDHVKKEYDDLTNRHRHLPKRL